MCSVRESLRQQNQGSQFAFSQLQLLVCVWRFLLLTCVHFLKLFTVLNFCHVNYSVLQLIQMLTCTGLYEYSQQIGWIYTVGPLSFFSSWICVCVCVCMPVNVAPSACGGQPVELHSVVQTLDSYSGGLVWKQAPSLHWSFLVFIFLFLFF